MDSYKYNRTVKHTKLKQPQSEMLKINKLQGKGASRPDSPWNHINMNFGLKDNGHNTARLLHCIELYCCFIIACKCVITGKWQGGLVWRYIFMHLFSANDTPTWHRWRALSASLVRIAEKEFVPSAARANQYDANRAGFVAAFECATLGLTVQGLSVVW